MRTISLSFAVSVLHSPCLHAILRTDGKLSVHFTRGIVDFGKANARRDMGDLGILSTESKIYPS